MKSLINKYALPLLALGLLACQKAQKPGALPEPVPLRMSINSNDLVMGETLEITFEVTGKEEGQQTTNEDVLIKLSANTERGAVDQLLFDNFPREVVMKQGERSKTISIPVKKEGLNKEWQVEIAAFVRGYKVESALKLVTVSNFHYARVSIKNNADNTVKEGGSFVLVASVNSVLKSPLEIQILPEGDMSAFLANLPTKLVIPAGASSVESDAITVLKSTATKEDIELRFNFATPAGSRYPLQNKFLAIQRLDIHKGYDTHIRDERWLYEDADQMFVSAKNEQAVKAWGQENYVVMKEGDPHPNSGKLLPEGKWRFFRSYEFHKIKSCLAKKASPMGDYTAEDYPLGFADQNTGAVETQGAVDNAKYAYVTDEGHLRMMTLKERAKSANTGKTWNFGTSAFYSCKFMRQNPNSTTWPSSNIRIYPGMRIETRARMRGTDNSGMLPGIWLQGNEQVGGNAAWNFWPDFGEIDVMENNSRHPNLGLRYGVEQTYHFGSTTPATGVGKYNPTYGVTELASGGKTGKTIIDEFQIYWFEWVDDNTVSIGTNGKETLRITKDMVEKNGARWPFSSSINDEGLYYILTMMFLHKAVPNTGAVQMDMSYLAARNLLKSDPNVKIPRMEVDWVRFYTDATYSDRGKPYRKDLLLY